MVDLDLPLQLHFGGISHHPTSLLSESKRTYIEHVMVRIGEGVIATVLNIVLTGVFDKYPEMDVIINEAGTNWIPHVAFRADNWYQNSPEDIGLSPRMREMDERYLDKMPSEYIREDMYVTTQPISLPRNPRLARGLLDASFAEDTFLFSTDWPHSAIDGPNWVFDNPQIDEDLMERIFRGNAREVYRPPS
jgi:predicted TIM-barrel fold metal-dependent hydrolase